MQIAATHQPFSTECRNLGKDSFLLIAFKTDGSIDQCAAALKVVLTVLDDVSVAEHATRVVVSVADALHLAGQESQYTVGVTGHFRFAEAIQWRFLRAPPAPDPVAATARCQLSPIGLVQARRLEFAGGDKSVPLATLANVPDLAAVLALRLPNEWPRIHDGRNCSDSDLATASFD